jgi:hypothetical protein
MKTLSRDKDRIGSKRCRATQRVNRPLGRIVIVLPFNYDILSCVIDIPNEAG